MLGGMVMQPASVFIMDVSNSSAAESAEELSLYIANIEGWINEWFWGTVSVKVKHRAGDELILLAEGYASAFVAAFYISRIWRYGKNRPYFGLSFGSIEKEVNKIDLEKWIHPLVKQARLANELLKKQKEREAFRFKNDESPNYSEYFTLVNGVLKLQHALFLEQTEVQRLVCSLYLIYEKQNTVAKLLDKSAPTIYSHFKKGHSEVILGSYHEIVNVLCSIQDKDFKSAKNDIWRLEERIQEHLKNRVHKVFEL
jgi:hypothetical protein